MIITHPYSYAESLDTLNIHEKNNNRIKEILDAFITSNPHISKSDFTIGGSSAGSYANYYVFNETRDVDIVLNEGVDYNSIQKTPSIDIMRYHAVLPDWRERLVEKDGYYILSQNDLMIEISFGILYKLKQVDFNYVQSLMINTEVSAAELTEKILATIEYLRETQEKVIGEEVILSNINLIKGFLSDRTIRLQKEWLDSLVEESVK